jgi:hypothetical protein
MLRKIASVVAVASMLASSAAYAADTTEQGALAPGNAAAIHEAQGMDMDVTMGILATVVVVAGIVLVVTSTGNGGHSTTGTTAFSNPS